MNPLTELARKYGTDKYDHGFTPFYHEHLKGIRDSARKILEIGVSNGASIRLWLDYFKDAEVFGFDNNHYANRTMWPLSERFHSHSGDQASQEDLTSLTETIGSNFDIILDDGGHTMAQQQISFSYLFLHLRPGGYYIIEDLHTSFMDKILLHRGGMDVESYETGCTEVEFTTHALVQKLADGKDLPNTRYLSDGPQPLSRINREIASAEIFDTNKDRRQITSIIRRRTSDRTDCNDQTILH